MDIALNIRRLRSGKNITLETLAEKAGVTKGFLSQVENMRALPSLPLLYVIAAALEVLPADLLHGTTGPSLHYVHTKKNKGLAVAREYPESGFMYKALAAQKNMKLMEPFVLEIPAGAQRKSVSTCGDEFILLLDGNIDFYLGTEKITMANGDSLYFEGEIPHYPHNTSKGPAKLLVIYALRQQNNISREKNIIIQENTL